MKKDRQANKFAFDRDDMEEFGVTVKPVIDHVALNGSIECEGKILDFHALKNAGFVARQYVVNFEGGASFTVAWDENGRLFALSARMVDIDWSDDKLIIRRTSGPRYIEA